jgi:hypothetical protein
MAEPGDQSGLRNKAKALKIECIMVVAQTKAMKKAIRTASIQFPNEPWSAEFIQKSERWLEQHGAKYF